MRTSPPESELPPEVPRPVPCRLRLLAVARARAATAPAAPPTTDGRFKVGLSLIPSRLSGVAVMVPSAVSNRRHRHQVARPDVVEAIDPRDDLWL